MTVTMSPTSVVSLPDDPFTIENISNPYPLHEKLREAGPVVWLEKHGCYAVTRYEWVYEILTDFESYCSSGGLGPKDIRKEAEWRPPSILESDPPTHTVMRRGLAGVISPSTMRRLREQFAPFAEELAEEVARRGDVDGIVDIAERYPLKVFPDAVGLRPDGRENLLPYGSMVFNAFGADNDIRAAAFQEGERVAAWVMDSCERENLTETGLGADIWTVADEGRIEPQQATLLVRALLSAGVDTTIFGIGNTLYNLAKYPEQWEKLKAKPQLAKFAVDEALRVESPFQMFHRTSTVDTEIGGVHIPADSKILLFMGAANRDPRKWGEDADVFDLDRNASGHVAFGMGLHQCVGQPIARTEIELMLQALATRVDRIELTGEVTPWIHNVLRGFARMPLRLVPNS
ncbi:cytochrome P450 [Citricoccus sp.]|uniref:cytochrome P450 n=1 Tax=Citricoccus sp. TaxID=1978372 RepID=UPI002637A1C7|nr:cytochrome P450 [Citricoccus sp.]HRO30733.1 cytochrome P450 [Citricoccus sp.]HRO94692.1 cytochrome P450 [Citricoccus sp.]